MKEQRIPKVSVIIPSYNHENFIEEAINSVLGQTFQDFELIIADDASKDDSVKKINKFKDERIQFYEFKENKGAVYTTNFCINKASGEYIALLNSDDIWMKNKLELQVQILDNNKKIGAVFGEALFVNENKEILTKANFQWADVFKKKNRNGGEWLKYFFFNINCLCHPSILIRKEIYDKTTLYNPCFRQLPDFYMWVNILKFTEIYIIAQKLVEFRIFQSGANASASTKINSIRSRNEIYLIMKDFFNNISIERFKEGFADYLINKNISSEEEMLCEQAFIYFKMKSEISHIYKLIGIEKLYSLLRNEKTRDILKRNYKFCEKDFFNITGGSEIMNN